ncbi:PIN domain-containing protein [Vagococcus zengguangii]|uniref:PIN domain-containing protein n=1 Tax=Vagococcus zengguangii TaxID=2571750 RepID=UPI0011095445|nr:PIN domain-containing protein [Vagococcus zengguangii]TLG79739.1 hypothetical protein FE258_07705 [Vagococcus zengguangii]
MKIMFDSNIFDRLDEIDSQLKGSEEEFDYYITSIQVQELSEIPDTKKEVRTMNLLRLAKLRAKLISTSVAVYGYSRYNMARMGDGIVYNQMLNDSKNNIKDAIIADTAVNEMCTLVTEDDELYKKMTRHNYSVLKMEEFLDLVKKKNN